MKKAFIFCITKCLVLLTIPALSYPYNITVGPYRASFELGGDLELPETPYHVTTAGPKESETLGGEKYTSYFIKLENTDKLRIIGITIEITKEKSVYTLDNLNKILQATFNKDNYKTIASDTREIDYTMGEVAEGNLIGANDIKRYLAIYNPLFDPEHTVILIDLFNLPWDGGTLQLLKTIHVEKIGT